MKLKKKSATFFLLLLVIVSCESSKVPAVNFNYFPLETGQFAEYSVTETRYSIGQPPVTSIYQLREVIGLSYMDASGATVYQIGRSRKDGTDNWVTDSIITTWKTTDKGIRVENGQAIVKLRFPVESQLRWNGNEFNSLGEQTFELKNVDNPFSTDLTNFENTVTVLQQNDSTLVSLKRRKEIFADQIGLIHRERTSIYYCTTNDCVGKGQILYGIKQVMTLTHSGKL